MVRLDDDRLYGVRETERILGKSRATIWKARRSGQLGYTMIGGSVRFGAEDLRTYVEHGRRNGGNGEGRT